jgi:RNA polymerase sigma factor (sigma-70 family)
MQADLTMGNLASALTLQSEEAALIAELQAGSEEAFAWLIARFHQPIYSLLARTVQDRADAADLTQEVFVKVFRGVGNFHGESSLRTWIYRIALREASNQRRWWMRHKQQEIPIEQEMAEGERDAGAAERDAGGPGRVALRDGGARGEPGAGGGGVEPGAGAVPHHADPARHRGICLRGSGGDAGRESGDGEVAAGARARLLEGDSDGSGAGAGSPARARDFEVPLGEEAR